MIHAAVGAVPALDSDALEFIVAGRMAAARAFRVLRDARTLTVEAQVDFIVRAPEGGLLARFAHPGPWAVTLEPQVAVIDGTGAWLSGDRRLAVETAPLLPFFERHPQVSVLGRARTPYLAAWAATGRDFDAGFGTLRALLDDADFVRELETSAADAALGGLLRGDGRVAVWSAGELTDVAERIAKAEQAAQIRRLTLAFDTLAPQ